MVNFRQLLQDEMTARFIDQDPATGNFDVTFRLGEKLLYTNRCVFAPHSKMLEAQTSALWNAGKEQTVVSTFQYSEFYQLMRFLYGGNCNVTPENAVVLMQVADFYGVEIFKMYLEEVIAKWDFSWNTVFQYLPPAKRASMDNLVWHLSRAVFENLEETEDPNIIAGIPNNVAYQIIELAKKDGKSIYKIFKFAFRWAVKTVSIAYGKNANIDLLQSFKNMFVRIAPNLLIVYDLNHHYIRFAVKHGRGIFSANHVSCILRAIGFEGDDVFAGLDFLIAIGMP